MPYCQDCGSEVEEGDQYCANCGTAVRSVVEDPPEQSSADANHDHSDRKPSTVGLDDGEKRNWRRAAIAAMMALLPAFGAYLSVAVAFYNPSAGGLAFLVAWPVLGYLVYQRPTTKAMVGGAVYWLAVETWLTPLAFAIYTFTYASQEVSTGAGQAGAAIGGFVLVIGAFVVGVPLGLVLYLISGRLDADEPSAAPA